MHSQSQADDSMAVGDYKDMTSGGESETQRQRTTAGLLINGQDNYVTVTKSHSEGHHCSESSFHPSHSHEDFLIWLVCRRTSRQACVWLHSKPLKAGFTALWEIRQGLPYESSILKLKTGFNTTRSLREAGAYEHNLGLMVTILKATNSET